MKITLSNDSLGRITTDVLVAPVRNGHVEDNVHVKALDKLTKGALRKLIKHEDWKAKRGDVLRLQVHGGLHASRILLIGVGKKDKDDVAARLVAHKAADVASKYARIAVLAISDDAAVVRATAEGLLSGSYRYVDYFTGERAHGNKLKTASIVLSSKQTPAQKQALTNGIAIGEATCMVRDLVNCPPNDMTPVALANRASEESKKVGITCQIFDKAKIQKLGMNLLIAVNKGSGEQPRFIHMKYVPEASAKSTNKTPRVVFVGKGLTFDSGGLCLKPSKSMLDMKCDMAGGALTMAIVVAAAKLKLPIEVHAVVPSTENMTGDFAYRPGDVYKSLDGKTVEIINTDAEGRLILADALAYARKLEPDYMIDHATLTGACIVALGQYSGGLFSNDEKLASAYLASAEYAGESYWRLPLNEDLRDLLKSDIADLKHTGESHGGAITAALFLREFVGKTAWAHLDIAGPAFLDRAKGIYPKGGSGFGLLTAIRFLEQLAT